MRIFRAIARRTPSRSCRLCSCCWILTCAAFLSALDCLFKAFCIRSLSFSCGVILGLAAPVSLPPGVSGFLSLSAEADDGGAEWEEGERLRLAAGEWEGL